MRSLRQVLTEHGFLAGPRISLQQVANRLSFPRPVTLARLAQDILDVPVPVIDAFTISPRQISSGQAISIHWRISTRSACTLQVTLTQKDFHTGTVLSRHNGLGSAGDITEKPERDSNYFLDANCHGTAGTATKRVSVSVANPV